MMEYTHELPGLSPVSGKRVGLVLTAVRYPRTAVFSFC